MSDLGSTNWSETDASNNAAVPDGWPEGMAPSGVNNAARANMGGVKRWWNRINRTKVTGGTATALTLTYDVAHASYYDGELYSFTLHTANGSAATVNVNALGAAPLRVWDVNGWSAVVASEFLSGQSVIAAYNSAAVAFDALSGLPRTIAGNKTFTGANTHTGGDTFSGTVTLAGVAINEALATAISSASAVNIGAAAGNSVHITGTTTITSFVSATAGVEREVIFDGALTLTHSAASIVNIGGANIATMAGDVAAFRSEGAGVWRMTRFARSGYSPAGEQEVYSATTDGATGSTAIPYDDTIPQNTEGDQYLSASITPKSATSRLLIDVTLFVASSATDNPIVALFQDATANALAATVCRIDTAAAGQTVRFSYSMTSGATSSTTFKVRAGSSSGATLTVNGFGGVRKLGGVFASSIRIREVMQ